MRTSLSVTGLEIHGYHGLFDEERLLGQKFLFGVFAQLTAVKTHLADKLDTSIRYDELVMEIVGISDKTKFHTLEALAEAIARQIIERFEKIQNVTVSVAKASPPIPHTVEQIRVEIHLDRDDLPIPKTA